ncbi:hypothetical protein BJF90_17880 [Pseudonocardia sp. CNS-004]|nr:hypothetical protein BJF90_17880 [Pseudonocardia sp. CNS-004]
MSVPDRRGVLHVACREAGGGFGVAVADRLEDVVVVALQSSACSAVQIVAGGVNRTHSASAYCCTSGDDCS